MLTFREYLYDVRDRDDINFIPKIHNYIELMKDKDTVDFHYTRITFDILKYIILPQCRDKKYIVVHNTLLLKKEIPGFTDEEISKLIFFSKDDLWIASEHETTKQMNKYYDFYNIPKPDNSYYMINPLMQMFNTLIKQEESDDDYE